MLVGIMVSASRHNRSALDARLIFCATKSEVIRNSGQRKQMMNALARNEGKLRCFVLPERVQ